MIKLCSLGCAIMRLLLVMVLLGLGGGVLASESLPNQAVLQKSAPEKGPGKSLSGDEMASLYLQSPTLVSNAETKNGMDAVDDEKRYVSTDLQERDRLSRQNMPRANSLPPPKPEPLANPAAILPLLKQMYQHN